MDGESTSISSPVPPQQNTKKKQNLIIEGCPIEGISIAGQKTCVIFPSIKLAFNIGRCPQSAIFQEFVFISRGHMDYIGGLTIYVEECEKCKMKAPTIFIPNCLKENVEGLFEVDRDIKQTGLKHNLIVLNIGEEYQISIQNLSQDTDSNKKLNISGVEIKNTISTPEIAFTGDTKSDFILDPNNSDMLKSRILVMESTFVHNQRSVKEAREKGHTHLFEISRLAHRFLNKAVLLIHFSALYHVEEIKEAIRNKEKKQNLSVEGYQIEGISVKGQKTCVTFPSLNLGFDIGRCPESAVSQDFVFISHKDHIDARPKDPTSSRWLMWSSSLFHAGHKLDGNILPFATPLADLLARLVSRALLATR
ncbi:hypothetical protein LUZ60_012373 [Juncus effusus]|nr:hypothetical protein LUZ60_012373 [Juncus effusus]